MAHGGSDGIDEGRLDLVPMIDTVMLLLIFFVLTTKFNSEEKAISSLLPTNKGQMASTPTKVEEVKQVNICIYPPNMVKGLQPSGYRDQLQNDYKGGVIPNAWIRIGNDDPILVEGKILNSKDGKIVEHINNIHEFVEKGLERYKVEGAAERKDQLPVIIHCFSGMSWRFALVIYDAVRSYEGKHAPPGYKFNGDPMELLKMREVSFAPPRIRNYDPNELGNELYEIVQMK